MGGTTQTQDRTTSQQTQPWAPAQPVLTGILGQLGNVNPNLTGAENSALSGLSANAGFLNQFTPQATGLANSLLAGGGPDRTGMINDVYAQYQKARSPSPAATTSNRRAIRRCRVTSARFRTT